MVMDLSELKCIWEADKEFYKTKEIGELQDFTKEVLQNKELFNLKRGLGSTGSKNRFHEFTVETQKQGRRADIIIYINEEKIVIPVEIERHDNIKAGEIQLFQYQKDWNKKLGILTDGNEWRFYRSNSYITIGIDKMFKNPDEFRILWEDYIKPENYYIELFNPSGQQGIFSNKMSLDKNENRMLFFDEITTVIESFNAKMKAMGVWGKGKQTVSEKIAVETSYAYLIQFILYKVLVDNEYKQFNKEYNNLMKRVRKAITDEDLYSVIINEIKNISEYVSKNIYKPFEAEQRSINEKLEKNLKEELTIDDISPWLDMLIFINRYDFSSIENEIFGYIYENYLKDLYDDAQKGQYFTDPAVVNYMLKEIGYTEEKIKTEINNKKISIIDPSCGAGTFLYSAVDKIIKAFDNGSKQNAEQIIKAVNENIFGLDIEEFPLYLAEMSILMRLLPLIINDNYSNPIENKIKVFKTKDSVSEFLEVGIKSKEDAQTNFFKSLKNTRLPDPSFMRDEKDLEEMLISLQESGGARGRFDYVIANPPYIALQVCYNEDVRFATLMRGKNRDDTINENKILCMKNVYGVNLHSTPYNRKLNRPNPNLYAFFIALGLALLKDSGKMCYIIPQTLLTSRDYDVLRYYLSEHTKIEKIITFAEKMFIGRGLKQKRPVPTSSLIFVVKKEKINTSNHQVEVINFVTSGEEVDIEKYITNKNIQKSTKISQQDLCDNLESWTFIKHGEEVKNLFKCYNLNQNFSLYYDHKLAEANFSSAFYFDKGYSINPKKILQHPSDYLYPKYNNNFYNIVDIKGYWENVRDADKKEHDNIIKLNKANQKYKLLDSKYKVIWSYLYRERFFFTDQPTIWAGTEYCGIGSNNREEIIYLLGLLNSSTNSYILDITVKIENEKNNPTSTTNIKRILKVPIIKLENQHIKSAIIKETEKLLDEENRTLKDIVNLNTSMQKFKGIKRKGQTLILIDGKNREHAQEIKSHVHLVDELIEDIDNREIPELIGNDISLSDIRHRRLVSQGEQEKRKNHIDNMIFALYFGIDISEMQIEHMEEIENLCKKNKFYSLIN